MDDERLKTLGGDSYWKELLARIRDIRSSEKVLYRQVLDNYDAHGHTAAEVIAQRADAGKPFMGLLTFSKGGVVKKDIAIAKNYLKEDGLDKSNDTQF